VAQKPQVPWSDKAGREKYICEFVRAMWDRAELETMNDRERWTTAFELFQGKQDWGTERAEQDWMARPFLHEFSRIVRRAADAMGGLVFEKEDFFQMLPRDPENPGNVELARIMERITRHRLDEMKIEDVFAEYCVAAGAAGLGVLKVWGQYKPYWLPERVIEEIKKQEEGERRDWPSSIQQKEPNLEIPEDVDAELAKAASDLFGVSDKDVQLSAGIKSKKRMEFCIEASVVDPRNYGFEPDASPITRTRWHCERIHARIYELGPLFENGFFEKEKQTDKGLLEFQHSVGGLRGAGYGYEEQKLGTRNQFESNNEYTPKIELLEYFGPLISKSDGRVLEEDCHFVVANGKLLLRDAVVSTWTRQAPYILTVLSKAPFRPVGQGIADNAIDQQLLINDIFATFLDMYRLAVYQPIVIDDNALRDPDEVEQGLFPGMIIKTYGKKADDVFSAVPYNVQPGQMIFQVLQALRSSGEAGAGIDVTSANPSARARISATEIDANVQRGDESLMSLGRVLDSSFVKPLIHKVVELQLQFGMDAEELSRLVDQGVITESDLDLISNLGATERFNEMRRKFQIKIKGFRERMERQVMLRNVNEFLATIPGLPPEIISRLDGGNMLEDIVEAYGFDQNRWIVQNTPQDKAAEENRLLQNNQVVGIGEADQDQLELPVHFNGFLQAPTDAQRGHIMGHLERIVGRGEPIPQIPPQVAQLLGFQTEAEGPGGPPIQ